MHIWEIKNEYISIWSNVFLVFLMHIFSIAPICRATTNILKTCVLNAEFQYFILKFNKISLFYKYH
jgi:hypothetical protein